MPAVLETQSVITDIIASYEKRIEGIQALVDTTRLILMDYQESASLAREEQALINTRLQEILARNEHLRKKDYDLMIRQMVEPQAVRDHEVRTLITRYLDDQQRLAVTLKDLYGQIRQQLAQGNTPQIASRLKAIKELLAEQDQRKDELTSNLREVQAEHREMVSMVQALLVKGNALRIRDFKDMLARIQNQRRERIARKLSRREEVRQMLATFKQQRLKDPPIDVAWAAKAGPLGGLKEALEVFQFHHPQQGGTTTNETNEWSAGLPAQVKAG